MEKKKVLLTREEMVVTTDIHKEMMEAMAKRAHLFNEEKNFEVYSVALAFTISNMLITFGIRKNIKPFLDDMVQVVMDIHEDVLRCSSYMVYKKGEKIDEGNFH